MYKIEKYLRNTLQKIRKDHPESYQDVEASERVSGADNFNISEDSIFMVWVNVDKPTKNCTIHGSNCIFVLRKRETKYKGLGKIKRDGGWILFESVEDAYTFCKERFPEYKVRRHC